MTEQRMSDTGCCWLALPYKLQQSISQSRNLSLCCGCWQPAVVVVTTFTIGRPLRTCSERYTRGTQSWL